MNFEQFKTSISKVPFTDEIEYQQAIMWLHPEILPVGVVSIGDTKSAIIKIRDSVINPYGKRVPVITIFKEAFAGQDQVEEIVLPYTIERIPTGAFAGCTNLKRITIPGKIKSIGEGTFAGCIHLEDIYYEGTMEEWNNIDIVHHKHEIEFGDTAPGSPVEQIKAERLRFIPGNEALFTANIHFQCALTDNKSSASFELKIKGNDITDLFKID